MAAVKNAMIEQTEQAEKFAAELAALARRMHDAADAWQVAGLPAAIIRNTADNIEQEAADLHEQVLEANGEEVDA